MESNQYLVMFIDESREHLQALNDNMLELEQDPSNINIVQTIFRSAHTLKGMAATMGFTDLANLTHEMENILDLVRNHQLAMNETIFDWLFKSLDALEAMINDIVDGGDGSLDVQEIVTMLKKIAEGSSGEPASVSSSQDNGEGRPQSLAAADLDQYQRSVIEHSLKTGFNVYCIQVTLREDCVLKAARAYMVFDSLENRGEIIKSEPSVQDIEQEKFDQSFTVYLITKVAQDEIRDLILDISEIESVKLVPVTAESLSQQGTKDAKVTGQETRQPASSTPAKGRAAGSDSARATSRTIRVDIERLDRLMNLFSELLIDRVRLEQLASDLEHQELIETVEHMARVSSDLQNIVLKLRMMPVETVFNRFPRMIRDLSKNLNKKVELIVSGEDTELDRTVIDEIGDPLVHLLRNALDHGLEDIEGRIAAGKPETGKIYLRAYQSGNHVFIEIEDDGRGIQRDKIVDKAVTNGVISREDADRLSDRDVYQLLFESGFSTAEVVSDISGRGVGLDVVREKITSLGGHVSVNSTPGQGTIFQVQLPLTLSIITAMLIRIGTEKYAVPISSVVETSLITKEDIRIVYGMEMINFRDHIVPLIHLAEVLEVPDRGQEEEQEMNVVIVQKGEKMAALIVDELIAQQEIVLKTLGDYLTRVFAISGATILGDGQVALILDPNALIK